LSKTGPSQGEAGVVEYEPLYAGPLPETHLPDVLGGCNGEFHFACRAGEEPKA
jgi:hypothetical protein